MKLIHLNILTNINIRANGDISIEIRLKIVAVEDYPQVLLAPTYTEPPGGQYRSPNLYYGNDSRVYFMYAHIFTPNLALFLVSNVMQFL